MPVEAELKLETEKWLKKMQFLFPNITPLDQGGEELIGNIRAYVSDSAHFLKDNDLVHAFEAIVWAWAIAEIGKQLGALEYPEPK